MKPRLRCARCGFTSDAATLCPEDGRFLIAEADALRSDGDPRLGVALEGRFIPRRVLAPGSTATIYEAHDLTANATVVMKWLKRDLVGDAVESLALSEASALKRLRGVAPDLVAELEVEREPILVMSSWDGASIDATYRSGSDPSIWPEVARGFVQAVLVVHGRGVVHGDVSLRNAWRLPSGEIRLLDFGNAKVFEEGARSFDLRADIQGLVAALERLRLRAGLRAEPTWMSTLSAAASDEAPLEHLLHSLG